jgi:HEPN domain-containing protein
MKPLTLEWIDKAEGDYASAQREVRVRKLPNYDAVCFHAQQCVEKYIKARLQEADIPFPKVHDLVTLLDLVLPVEPLWNSFRQQLRYLSTYAVEVRYPGYTADKDMARQSVAICKSVRKAARITLGLLP